MRIHRSKVVRIIGAVGVVAGLSVAVGGAAFAGKSGGGTFQTTGSAAATIEENGNVSATVNGGNDVDNATSAVSLAETIATGTGIGTTQIKLAGTTGSDGTFGPLSFFSTGLSKPGYSGSVPGTLMDGSTPAANVSFRSC